MANVKISPKTKNNSKRKRHGKGANFHMSQLTTFLTRGVRKYLSPSKRPQKEFLQKTTESGFVFQNPDEECEKLSSLIPKNQEMEPSCNR